MPQPPCRSSDAWSLAEQADYCWRCDAVRVDSPLGCCDRCVADLRSGRTSAMPLLRFETSGEQLAQFRASASAAVEAARRVEVAMRPALERFGAALKRFHARLEAAGLRYDAARGEWITDPLHDPRTLGLPPGSLRRRRRGRSHR